MNMMQLAAFAKTNPGLTRTSESSIRNRPQNSKDDQVGRERFSRILERSCGGESSKTPEAKTDTKAHFKTEGRLDTETETEIKTDAKSEDDLAGDKSVQDQDVSRQMDLLSQLAEILKVLGFVAQDESNADTATVTGDSGQNKQFQVAAMLNPDQLKQGQTELRQVLNQLIDVLNKQGTLPKGLSDLKMIAESGLSLNNEVPVTAFLDKLLEAAKQALQQTELSEKGIIIPLETVASKSASEVASLKGFAAETDEPAPADLQKVQKVESEDSLVNTNNSDTAKSDSLKNFSQDLEHRGKDAKVVLSDFKALNNHPQNSSVSLNDNGNETSKFPLQPELQINGQAPGVMLQSEAATMPRMTHLIFNQIAQNAKLVVTPGTTEMQIQLKPDFLGKLNLSISSDNGLITAKFTAESHAVKGIIEANLNTLKDALSQQGVKVDQLVVDVGAQNHQSGFENREGYYGNGHTRRNHVSVNNQEIENLFSNEAQAGAIKDYYGSTVEYTA